MDGNKKPVDVENWQGVDEYVPFFPVPIILKHFCVRVHILVREHCALASSCRTTRIENCCNIVVLAIGSRVSVSVLCRFGEQRSCAVNSECEDEGLIFLFRGNRRNPTLVFGATDDDRRARISKEVLNLCTLVSSIQRNKNISRPECRQIEQHGLY